MARYFMPFYTQFMYFEYLNIKGNHSGNGRTVTTEMRILEALNGPMFEARLYTQLTTVLQAFWLYFDSNLLSMGI
jgi:hypothetical protein